jgi:oxygen-independent coproporphyrinogen-3 oxidase
MDERAGMASLYIHIPFCAGKCYYCDFLSFPLQDASQMQSYLEALNGEMPHYAGLKPETLYIGGGTPSLLSPEQFEYLMAGVHRCFDLGDLVEFTIEANPDSLNGSKAEAWNSCGVNRVSLGVQSFNDGVLAGNRRPATMGDAVASVGLLKGLGYGNICVDLILGLRASYTGDLQPDTVSSVFMEDLSAAVDLSPAHISIYMLEPGAGSLLAGESDGSGIVLIDDRAFEELYLFAVDFLAGCGFHQYEISNFALPGFESLHNLNYWQGGDYIGLGPGAVSTVRGKRWTNYEKLGMYEELTRAGNRPIDNVEELGGIERSSERIMLALRQSRGIDFEELLSMANSSKIELEEYVSGVADAGYAVLSESRFHLTPRGFLRSNIIITDIIRIIEKSQKRHS